MRLGWHWRRNEFHSEQENPITALGPVIRELLRRLEQLEERMAARDNK